MKVTRTNRFYYDSGWYIDLKLVPKAQCAMILGADALLQHFLRHSKTEDVTLKYSNREITSIGNWDICIEKIAGSEDKWGAWYELSDHSGDQHSMCDLYWQEYPTKNISNRALWLCNVTKFLFFGKHPNKIWIKQIHK